MPSSPNPAERRSRAASRDLLLALIRSAGDEATGGISRAELVRRSGLARGTVNAIVDAVRTDGLVVEEARPVATGAKGRPPRLLRLAPGAGCVVGIVVEAGAREVPRSANDPDHEVVPWGVDVRRDTVAGWDAGSAGADSLGAAVGFRLAVADPSGRVLAERAGSLDAEASAAESFDRLADAARETLASVPGEPRVWGSVLGLPVPIARETGTVLAGGTLPSWVGTRPGVELRRRLGYRCTVRNDADLCLLGEVTHGDAQGVRDVCMVTVGTGVGCGLLLDGRPHRGATGVAGELGHVQVDEAGRLCRCGNRGCLETIVAPAEILAALRASLGADVTLAQVQAAAAAGAPESFEPMVHRVLVDAGRMIGRVVADVANTVNPAMILLDGALVHPGGPIVEGVTDGVRRYARADVPATTVIRASALEGRAGLLGAITLALGRQPAPDATRSTAAAQERDRRRRRIVDVLRSTGPLPRSDVGHRTGLPRTAVAGLVADLVADGTVLQSQPAPDPTRVGRPSPLLRLAPESGLLLAFAPAERHTRVVVAAGSGRILIQEDAPATPDRTARQRLVDAGVWTRELLTELGHGGATLLRAGISVPAPIHPRTGRLAAHGILPMFSDFSPGEDLSQVLGCPVMAENNANLAAVAECHSGAAKGGRDVLYVRADAYAGAGLVTGGRLYRGFTGYAGEIGHLRVRETGPLCICGNRGCLGQFLAPGYFGAVLDPAAATTTEVIERALADGGRLLGRALAALCDVLNPAIVVVGGTLVDTGGPGRAVVDGVRESLLRHCPPAVTRDLQVVPAALGGDAELYGVLACLMDLPVAR